MAAKKVQIRLRSRPREPAKVAAEKIEEVLATQGELYLNPKQHALPWWQSFDESSFDVHLATGMLSCLVMTLSLLTAWTAWVVLRFLVGLRYVSIDQQNHHYRKILHS